MVVRSLPLLQQLCTAAGPPPGCQQAPPPPRLPPPPNPAARLDEWQLARHGGRRIQVRPQVAV